MVGSQRTNRHLYLLVLKRIPSRVGKRVGMMRWNPQTQGYGECMLATIATLAGVDLAEVRDRSLDLAEVEIWHHLLKTGTEGFWSAVTSLIIIYDLRGLIPMMQESVGEVSHLPSRGYGSIMVVNGPYRHIMPWKDRYVYDTQNHPVIAQTLSEWLEEHPKWEVESITHGSVDKVEPPKMVGQPITWDEVKRRISQDGP